MKITRNKEITLPVYDPEKCSFFALGRNAMYVACKSLGLKKGDVVLTPALDCDSTLTPFKALGLTPEFYRSDPYTFEVDIDDIENRLNPQVKLLHVINYFDLPQPWDSLLAFRKETGIPILEDNAFSLLSKYHGVPLGSFGDFAFFSLYKTLPIIDGGMLKANNPEYSLNIPPRTAKWFYPTERKKVIGLIASMLGYQYMPATLLKRLSHTSYPLPPLYSNKPGYPEWQLRDVILKDFSCDYYRPMSKIARIQLGSFSNHDFHVAQDKIRFYYKMIIDKLKEVRGIQVLWEVLPDEITPNCVSLLIDSHRDDILYELKAKKYGVIAWPTFSGDVIDKTDEYPEIEIIGRKIIQLMIPFFRVTKNDADSYFKNLADDVINCIMRY